MMVKFFSGGTGKGGGIVDYLLRDKDAKGLPRHPFPELLRGDPYLTVQLINTLDFKYKFDTGVISFAPSDAPTEDQQQALMDSFAHVAFAGLEPERYNILWVKHRHTSEGRIELHFVIPRVELTTGKSLSVAPPGHQYYFAHWRDYWNYKEGWASPEDPSRARVYHPNYHALIDAQNKRLELVNLPFNSKEDFQKIISEYLVENIKLGRLQKREDIIRILEENQFQIPRQGENYLTVYREDIGQRIRLKGGMYRASWRLGQTISAEPTARLENDRSYSQRRVRASQEQLEEKFRKRLSFNAGRYGEVHPDLEFTVEATAAQSPTDRRLSLRDFLDQQLGHESVFSQSTQTDPEQPETNSSRTTNFRTAFSKDLGSSTVSEQPRPISHPTPQQQPTDQLEMQWQTLYQALEAEKDERIRERTLKKLRELYQTRRSAQATGQRTDRELDRSISNFPTDHQSIHQQLEDLGQHLNEQSGRIEQANRKLDGRLQPINRGVEQLKRRYDEELERLKTEVNLVEYAQSQGYELDRQKSSRHCPVLTNGAGDKILVGVDRNDGHYFYYSVRDESDSGSIIDFIQKRRSLNLGEVRKELRPWISGSYSPTDPNRKPAPKPTPTTPDRHKILAQFESFRAISHHPYLNARGIRQQTIERDLFSGTIYTDSRDNIIFPHFDSEGICGYEIRNQQFKGFSGGGTKGLWCSRLSQGDTKLVVCESPIDCLSYHQLFPEPNIGYLATSGTLSDKQKELIGSAFEKIHQQGGEILIATDSDAAGQEIAQELKKLAPQTVQMSRVVPKHHKDWNEALVAQIRGQQKSTGRSRSRVPEL